MADRLQIAQRREQVQRLLTMRLSTSEIANSLGVPFSTVRKDITWLRRFNARWWEEHSTVKARLAEYLHNSVRSYEEILREGWASVYALREEPKAKLGALSVVLGAQKALDELFGFTGVTMADLEAQEQLSRLQSEFAEIKRLAGIAQNNTIQP